MYSEQYSQKWKNNPLNAKCNKKRLIVFITITLIKFIAFCFGIGYDFLPVFSVSCQRGQKY